MISRLLIANRGEIACRIIRTAKQLGIYTIAVYSHADAQAQHVLLADEAHVIGPAPAAESYLVVDTILDVAMACRADAIHPGYGFLSENPALSKGCKQHGIKFVGPDEYALHAMGSKSEAKKIMAHAGVPLVPGYHGKEQAPDFLRAQAVSIGYPVIIKASAGGGGKGMRIVEEDAQFSAALAAAKREAQASFGDTHMLVEKYIVHPRHIEVQVFCDRHGNGVYLFDRDCSVQRRHQKIVEEAPAPGLSDELRQAMGHAAVDAALAIDYVGAGTVEFLLDAQHDFYFMEMNTRLQVEHPVTEMVTNEDLVAWQLDVAADLALPKTQDQLTCQGHAIEVRLYAEDPSNQFLPATGTLSAFRTPAAHANIRVDSGVIEGDDISIYYDPMFAKLICFGNTRTQAIQLTQYALSQFFIAGCTTNISYLQSVLAHSAFQQGEVSTHFIDTYSAELLAKHTFTPLIMAALGAVIHQLQAPPQPDYPLSQRYWRSNLSYSTSLSLRQPSEPAPSTLTLTMLSGQRCHIALGEHEFVVEAITQIDAVTYVVNINSQQLQLSLCEHEQHQYTANYLGQQLNLQLQQADLGIQEERADTSLSAPMNGTVVNVPISPPCDIQQGDTIMIIEAMKMEHNVTAPTDGRITEIFYQTGDLVSGGAELVDFVAFAKNEAS